MKDLARRINFFTTAFLGILSFSLINEIFMEDDIPDKVDDLLFVLIGIAAIWWYKKKGYMESKTAGSIILLVIGILTKLGAIIIEHGDKEAVGDDIGVFIALLIAFGFVVWQTFSLQKQK